MAPELADGRDSPPIGQFLQGTCCNIGNCANIFIENGKWDNPVGAEGCHKESSLALADFPPNAIVVGHWNDFIEVGDGKDSLQSTDVVPL